MHIFGLHSYGSVAAMVLDNGPNPQLVAEHEIHTMIWRIRQIPVNSFRTVAIQQAVKKKMKGGIMEVLVVMLRGMLIPMGLI